MSMLTLDAQDRAARKHGTALIAEDRWAVIVKRPGELRPLYTCVSTVRIVAEREKQTALDAGLQATMVPLPAHAPIE